MFHINFVFNKSERVLVFGLAAILVSLIIQGMYFAHYITSSTADFMHAYDENVNSITHLSLAHKYLADLRLQLSSYPIQTLTQRQSTMKLRGQTKDNLDKSILDFKEYLKICDEYELREKELAEYQTYFDKYWKEQIHFFELVDQGKLEEAVQLRTNVTNPLARAASDTITKMFLGEKEHSIAEGKELQQAADLEAYKVWGFVGISTLLSLVYLLLLINRFNKLRDELQKAELVHQNRMNVLAMTAANIGHEIKNPLTVIKGRIAMALKKIQSKSDEYDKIETDLIQSTKHTDRILKIVNGLKSLSYKDDSSPMEEQTLSSIMIDTIDLAEQKVKQHFIELKIATEIPDLILYCHPVQLSQVILNLVNNSCDAISLQEEKWIEISYVLIAEANDSLPQKLLIQVTDSGGGISKELAAKIIQPFFTTKKRGEGTGIGLAISQEIIKDHGGELRIDSNCKNTRFEIILPIHRFSSQQVTKVA